MTTSAPTLGAPAARSALRCNSPLGTTLILPLLAVGWPWSGHGLRNALSSAGPISTDSTGYKLLSVALPSAVIACCIHILAHPGLRSEVTMSTMGAADVCGRHQPASCDPDRQPASPSFLNQQGLPHDEHR